MTANGKASSLPRNKFLNSLQRSSCSYYIQNQQDVLTQQQALLLSHRQANGDGEKRIAYARACLYELELATFETSSKWAQMTAALVAYDKRRLGEGSTFCFGEWGGRLSLTCALDCSCRRVPRRDGPGGERRGQRRRVEVVEAQRSRQNDVDARQAGLILLHTKSLD